MIDKTYRCDLCRSKFEPEQLIGIYFTQPQGFERRDSRQTERHICRECLASAHAIAAELHKEYFGG